MTALAEIPNPKIRFHQIRVYLLTPELKSLPRPFLRIHILQVLCSSVHGDSRTRNYSIDTSNRYSSNSSLSYLFSLVTTGGSTTRKLLIRYGYKVTLTDRLLVPAPRLSQINNLVPVAVS